MMVGALASGLTPSAVDAARTLDTGRRNLFPPLFARPQRGPSRRDVARDTGDVDQAHAAAAGRHGSTHHARINPVADRPHLDIAATSCDRHREEFDMLRFTSAQETAPFVVVTDDGSGSAEQARHAHILHQTRQRAALSVQDGAFLCSDGLGPWEGAPSAFWPRSVRLVTFLVCHRRG